MTRKWTIHRTFGLGFIDRDKPNAVVSGAAVDQPTDVVDAAEAERYREALERLRVHPLLTRGAGPLEQAALRIVREALR